MTTGTTSRHATLDEKRVRGTRTNPSQRISWSLTPPRKDGEGEGGGAKFQFQAGVGNPEYRVQSDNQLLNEEGLIAKAMENLMCCPPWEEEAKE
jgi:hypothetical protein